MQIKTPHDFSWIHWTPDQIEQELASRIQEKKAVIEAVKALDDAELTFENTLYALEEVSDEAKQTISAVYLLMNVSNSAEIRKTAKEAIDRYESSVIDLYYDPEVFLKLTTLAEKKLTLAPADQKLLSDTLRSFRRLGLALPAETREKLKNNLKRMAKLSSDFQQNINEWSDEILVTQEELEGTSLYYQSELPRDEQGRYRISLEYPSMVPFMENALNSEKRKDLARKNLDKGGVLGTELLRELLDLRRENARLLSYAHHADFVTEERMAGSAKTAENFLLELAEKLKPKVAAELAELKKLKKEIFNSDEPLEYFDIAFLINRHKQQHLNISGDSVREYFALPNLLKEMFSLYSQIFSVQFEELPSEPLWDEQVKKYTVKENGKTIGVFFLDLFPRENTFSHAAVFGIQKGKLLSYGGSENLLPKDGDYDRMGRYEYKKP